MWPPGLNLRRFLVLALSVPALLAPASASQTYPGAPPVEQLARRAALVVIGDVVSAVGAWDAGQTTIETRVELTVAETLRGGPVSTVAFFQLGGRAGDRVIAVAGATTFAAGQRVLVFLERRPDGSLRLSDPSHATFRVERDPATGRDQAVRATGAPHVDRLPLDQVRTEVRRAPGGPS